MKHVYLIFLFALLQACVPQSPRITTTESGCPEVIIAKPSVKDVHDALVNMLLMDGVQIVTDHPANIVVTRQMDSSRAAGQQFAASFVNGEKGNIYNDELSYAFFDTQNGVRVIGRRYIVKQSRTGQTVRSEDYDNDGYNRLQNGLNYIKNRIESAK